MQTHLLPLTNLAAALHDSRIPCGLVRLDPTPGTSHHGTGAYSFIHIPAAPARHVLVLLPLYYAHAYPAHYYTHPVNPVIRLSTTV